MSIDLEDQLREAFGALPEGASDPAMSERAISRARGMRRRRTIAVGGGVTAVTAAVVAAGLVGATLRSGPAATGRLLPADDGTPAASAPAAHPTPDVTITSIAPGNEPVQPNNDLYQGKQIAQVGGYLLPHGSQLPNGLRYEDGLGHRHATSLSNASTLGMFLASGLGATGDPNLKPNAKHDLGIVATVEGWAFNRKPNGQNYADGDNGQQHLIANVTRFTSGEYASTALQKAHAGNSDELWFCYQCRELPWSGIPGQSGAHHLYDLGTVANGTNRSYLVSQVVGRFIVSADSDSKADAMNAVTSMLANLRNAKLVS